MRKYLVIFLSAVCVVAFMSSTSYSTAISESTGTITVDWTQLSNATWASNVYMNNGADANDGVTSISHYPGGGTAQAAFGTDVVGLASTTSTSVFSKGYVYNDGSGFAQSASGTSHLRRWFSVSREGQYTFTVDYVFTDFISLTDPSLENASGYHHAALSFWEGNTQDPIVTEAFSVGSNNPLSGTLTINKYLLTNTTYSFEVHTYNSAGANSPFQESPADPVPEPATLLLLGSGVIGVGGLRKKLKR